MTEEDRLLLNDLKANTKNLFKHITQLEEQKVLLEEQVDNLNKEIEYLEQENSDLGRKNEQLKIASQILSGKDNNGEATQKINFLIREIDRCIALLNK